MDAREPDQDEASQQAADNRAGRIDRIESRHVQTESLDPIGGEAGQDRQRGPHQRGGQDNQTKGQEEAAHRQQGQRVAGDVVQPQVDRRQGVEDQQHRERA